MKTLKGYRYLICTSCGATMNRKISTCNKCQYEKNRLYRSLTDEQKKAIKIEKQKKKELKKLNYHLGSRPYVKSSKLHQSIIAFIEPIIKRNHYCSEEELFLVIDYHILLTHSTEKYQRLCGIDQICLMYRDLCVLYKSYLMYKNTV